MHTREDEALIEEEEVLTEEMQEALAWQMIEEQQKYRRRRDTEKSLADLPDDQVRDENGVWLWLKESVEYK